MDKFSPEKKISLKAIESKNNIKYSLDIFITLNSNMEIVIKSLDNIPNIIYSEKFDLEKIKSTNKYFLICESISDVIYSIEPYINKISLIEENNSIKLIIPINHPLCKDAIFIIPKIKKDISDSIGEIYNLIYTLKNVVDNQQKTINEQNLEIKNLKERIEILERKEQNREQNQEPAPMGEEVNYLNDSLIIDKNNISKKLIKNWINSYRKISFQLIFRKSRDGSRSSDFHKHCDNQGATLCLIQTNKNYKFGGYTEIPWQSEYKLGKENEGYTFLFSLDSKKKFEKMKEGTTVFSDISFGPCFGDLGGCLYLNGDLNSGNTKNSNFLNNCELTNGEEGDFIVKEFEVYKVVIS